MKLPAFAYSGAWCYKGLTAPPQDSPNPGFSHQPSNALILPSLSSEGTGKIQEGTTGAFPQPSRNSCLTRDMGQQLQDISLRPFSLFPSPHLFLSSLAFPGDWGGQLPAGRSLSYSFPSPFLTPCNEGTVPIASRTRCWLQYLGVSGVPLSPSQAAARQLTGTLCNIMGWGRREIRSGGKNDQP